MPLPVNLILKLYFCRVKLLTIIFSFYILFLPSLPCMDKEECNEVEKASVSNMPCDKEHQHNDEACNPFCSCACCGQVFAPVFQLNKVVSIKPQIIQKQHFFYKNISLPTNFLGNIWQPPRLA